MSLLSSKMTLGMNTDLPNGQWNWPSLAQWISLDSHIYEQIDYSWSNWESEVRILMRLQVNFLLHNVPETKKEMINSFVTK